MRNINQKSISISSVIHMMLLQTTRRRWSCNNVKITDFIGESYDVTKGRLKLWPYPQQINSSIKDNTNPPPPLVICVFVCSFFSFCFSINLSRPLPTPNTHTHFQKRYYVPAKTFRNWKFTNNWSKTNFTPPARNFHYWS